MAHFHNITDLSLTECSPFISGVFLQFCYFLKQAGFAEKSIALFQALIEFNYSMPAVLLSAPRVEQVALFEPFWDSCVPRFGEEGAVGWSTWIQDKSMDFPPPLVSAGRSLA
jgi:hypothetical protein